MSTFTARFRGTCVTCENDILPGEEVIYSRSYGRDSEIVHVECPNYDDLAPIEVCPKCFIAPCDCEG